MANARSANVIVVDATAAYTEQMDVKAVKYIGAADSSATIKADSSTGVTVWEEAGTSNVFNEVCIKAKHGIYVTITGNAKVYIYLR